MKNSQRQVLTLWLLVLLAGRLDALPRVLGLPATSGVVDPIANVSNPDACGRGVVADDGTAETGYGWVPSVIDGQFVQTFEARDFQAGFMEEVCVCWLRTRPDSTIDFEVAFYGDDGGRPAAQPFWSVPARATNVPEGVTGTFYSVDVHDAPLPRSGRFYVGARWDASRDQYFFVCADHSPETEGVEVFFTDDRASGWASVFETSDPIFGNHRAMMVRAVGGAAPIPALGEGAVLVFAMLLAGAAVFLVRFRSSMS